MMKLRSQPFPKTGNNPGCGGVSLSPGCLRRPDFPETLSTLAGCRMLDGNAIAIRLNGDKIFPEVLKRIREARRSITIESYLWSSGKINDLLVEALCERARKGVKIQAISDGIGAVKLHKKDIRCMKQAGIEFVFYKREKWYHVKPNLSHRTHRKTFVCDGRIGVGGGFCIDDRWMGDGRSPDRWRDNGYLFEGPIVSQIQEAFVRNWRATTGALLNGPDYFPDLEQAGTIKAHFYYGAPGMSVNPVRSSIHAALLAAESHIRIGHGYFVPDDETLELLIETRKRGVRVEVVVPFINDTALGRAGSRSRWRLLLEAGVRIHRFAPAMYHCKYLVADDRLVIAGSANFDNRSFSVNDESNFNVYDRDFARAHISLFDEDKKQSMEYFLKDHDERPLPVKAGDWAAGCLRKFL